MKNARASNKIVSCAVETLLCAPKIEFLCSYNPTESDDNSIDPIDIKNTTGRLNI